MVTMATITKARVCRRLTVLYDEELPAGGGAGVVIDEVAVVARFAYYQSVTAAGGAN